MNAPKRTLVFASTLIVVTLLLSWTLLDDDATSTTSSSLLHGDQLKNEAMYDFAAGNELSSGSNQPPAAEDVLVQRLPGDNGHVLLMAYYSKENYAETSLTIDNGYTITLRDNGKGDDKVAGDGFYTVKISADVQSFRKQSISLLQQMKANGYRPLSYVNRQRIIDPDIAESFELAKFDAYQPVSISGLTNALSADFRPAVIAVTSMAASSITNGTVAASATQTAQAAATTTTITLDSIRKNSIFITNLAVVEDSTRTWNFCTQKGNVNGSWTFGTLMRQLASKSLTQIASDSAVSAYIKTWLKNWETTQVINRDSVKARTLVDSIILNPWLDTSRSHGTPAGQLDMRWAPFKLIAITNRFDLRTGLSCGEGRLVFCLISSACSALRNPPEQQFTVIFEYGVNQPRSCDAQHAWAQQWVNLTNFPLGSAQYNLALQNITDQFTKCGTNPSKPHQSSLDQLRTNEIALVLPTTINPKRWELREFILDSATGNLKETTVKQTPADKYNAQVVNTDVQHMVSYSNQNQAGINTGKFTVPLTWQGSPFLAGATRVNGNPTGKPTGNQAAVYHWDGTGSGNASTFIMSDNTRFNFSLQTCSGCHSGETQTAFTQINPAFYGREARLSGFLTGVNGTGGAIDFDHDSSNLLMTVLDPSLRPTNDSTTAKKRTFNDIDRRARDLQRVASNTCGSVLSISSQLMFQPSTSVH